MDIQGIVTQLSEQLHYDDGHSELDPEPIFNWRSIYGFGAPAESAS
jgi:hypothetical protein